MPRPTEPFKVAAVEFNPEMFEFDRNVQGACEVIAEAARNGARLIVLPEAALSGYIYRDREQFLPYMDTVPGKGTDAISAVTSEYNCYVAIGIAEVDRATGLTYNTGALIGPQGYIGKYRKAGLNPSDIVWFMPGNTGYPVFDTELGKIAMVICYDDTYWEPARLPAIKGADLIAYICSSDRVLPELAPEAQGNHSTIAAVQQLNAFNGLAMVAADRSNSETNPTTGVTVTYGGCASIWQATGERIAHAPATTGSTTLTHPGSIIYAEIDPACYDNEQRATLQRRRPELYTDLAFFRAPTDNAASREAHAIDAIALQYRVAPGEFTANADRAESLIGQLLAEQKQTPRDGALIVLPAFSFAGQPLNRDHALAESESMVGRTVQILSDFAVRTGGHIVGSFIERGTDIVGSGTASDDTVALFHTVVLVGPDGTVLGSYRQTHLDPDFTDWAHAGDALAVIDTAIGKIGLLACQDVRFPEAAGVLAIRRADLIAVPTRWDGSYGGPLHDAGGLFAHQYPPNTMCQWYATAKLTQAYTVVANPVDDGCQGSSGVFSINPVDSDEPPVVASSDAAAVVVAPIRTHGDPGWWMNQSRLVGGRRADLAVPAMLPVESDAFRQWQQAPGFDVAAWTAYQQ